MPRQLSRNSVTARGLINLALCCCLGFASARGQDSPAETSGALRLPVDHLAAGKLERVSAHIRQGEMSPAVALLAELWPNSAVKCAKTGNQIAPIRQSILKILAELPAADQQRFWAQLESSLAPQHRFSLPTKAGLQAWRGEAERLRDHGSWAMSAAAWARIETHHAATPAERQLAEVHRLQMLLVAGETGAVSKWLAAASAPRRQRSLVIGGVSTTMAAWLEAQLSPRTETNSSRLLSARPAHQLLWEWDIIPDGPLQTGLQQFTDELRAEGVSRFAAHQPLLAGNRIIVRTPTGLAAVDQSTGQLLWQVTSRQAKDRASLATQQQQSLLGASVLRTLAYHAQTNTLWEAASHDERYLYHVVESGLPSEPSRVNIGYSLEAVELATGRPVWRGGGARTVPGLDLPQRDWTAGAVTETTRPAEFTVCGPPLVLGPTLFVPVNHAGELRLLAVDRETQDVEWSVVLGAILPEGHAAAPHTFHALSLAWTGELLICSTVCGAIVAVDPLERGLRWVTPIPATPSPGTLISTANGDAATYAALHHWREGRILLSGERLCCVSPESPFVFVLDRRTGHIELTLPRDRGLTLLGVTAELVIVLEPSAIRAHDLTTGRLRWRTVLGEVQGRGCLVGERCFQPLADGSVAVMELRDGKRQPGRIRSEIRWGHLTPLPNGWLSCDDFHVRKFADAPAVPAVIGESEAPAERLTAAQSALDAGEFLIARQHLPTMTAPEVRKLRHEIDLAAWKLDPQQSRAVTLQELDERLSRRDSAEACLALAEAALQQRRWEDAVQWSLTGLSLGQTETVPLAGETSREVRWDRAFQGQIRTAYQQANASAQASLDALLSRHWDRAQDQVDPFAVQQLEQRWRTLPWMRRKLPDDAAEIFLGISSSARELAWLTLARAEPETVGRQALWQLRQEWMDGGYRTLADDLDLRLMQEGPGQSWQPGFTVRQTLAESGTDLARLQRQLSTGRPDHWPAVVPRTIFAPDGADDAVQLPVPVDEDTAGIWDRVDVSVDRSARTLRFSGDGRRGGWTVALPKGNSPLQQYPMSYQAWGIGRFLVVRIGTVLLAVTPWNEHGEPSARVIWSQDLLASPHQTQEPLTVQLVRSRWKQAREWFRIQNHFGHDVFAVGPVCAGYLCYRQQGKLIAVETHTGKLLWERWDLPTGSLVVGNENHVVIWSTDHRRVEALDAADGQTRHVGDWSAQLADVWHQDGVHVWLGETAEPVVRFSCHDLVTHQPLWAREFPAGSLPLPLDRRIGAIWDSRGLLHLIDLNTGTTQDEPLTVSLPESMQRVFVSHDEHRWYLGVSGPIERGIEWQAAQPLTGYRRPVVRGPLLAIDRASRQLVWQRQIEGEPWLLDQNRSSPVLVQMFKVPGPDLNQGVGEGVIRLFDKRTGRPLFEHRHLNLQPYYTVDPQPEFQKCTIRLVNGNVQLDYAPSEE